jgi:hypothetical protein
VKFGHTFWALSTALVCLCICVTRTSGREALIVPPNGTLALVLQDPIASENYQWPRTLLRYRVRFERHDVGPATYRLAHVPDGAAVPLQWDEVQTDAQGAWTSAVLCFFSALRAGATERFELAATGTPAAIPTAHVSATKQEQTIVITSDRLAVAIPAGGLTALAAPPAPIGRLWAHDRLLATGTMEGKFPAPVTVATFCEAAGPLFSTWRIEYRWQGRLGYVARVKVTAGYDHFEFSENVPGGDQAVADGRFRLTWDGLHPTRRFAANAWGMPGGSLGIDEPVITDGLAEDPHWFPPETVEQPAREMIYSLGPFQGNQPRNIVPVMSFWEPASDGLEVSAFVTDPAQWRGARYSVWQPTPEQNVRFRFADGKLSWWWPYVEGVRTTAIAVFPTATGAAETARVTDRYVAQTRDGRRPFTGNILYNVADMPLRYGVLLRSWYGALDLDRVKAWTLRYPEPGHGAFPLLDGLPDTIERLRDDISHSVLMLYPLGLNLGVMNISHRAIMPLLQRYAHLRDQCTAGQRAQIDALLLLCAYLNNGDELAPLISCLGGTPNMAADSLAVPAEISALFPRHPTAAAWRDRFGKAVALHAFFYERPPLPTVGALGGRWTESLATYHWAHLLPLTTAALLTKPVDGIRRLAVPGMEARTEWLTGQLTAPIDNPNPTWRVRWEAPAGRTGLERQFPAHGAHSSGTTTVPPAMLTLLAEQLNTYAPLAAEHLRWIASQVTSTDKGEWATNPLQQAVLKTLPPDHGTPPLLQSESYTGHGFVLRAGVGTPHELSLHLDQVDAGPNYRWGNTGEGGSGLLSFYAGGKVWTGHESENVGDHTIEDTVGHTTFGVWKDGAYRSIGANVLERPLLDVGVAQLAEITARQAAPYAAPQYTRRAVLLVGTDYFLVRDDASGPGRFSWFIAKDLSFPKLVFLSPPAIRADHWSEVRTRMSRGIMRDTPRESKQSVVLVTHKLNGVSLRDRTVQPVPEFASEPIFEVRGAGSAPEDIYHVAAPQSDDRVFFSRGPLRFIHGDQRFEGEIGVIRSTAHGGHELALLRGSRIAAGPVDLAVTRGAVALSATFTDATEIRGQYCAPSGSGQLQLNFQPAAGAAFYVDGVPVQKLAGGPGETVDLSVGTHLWEVTSGAPVPPRPVIMRTENFASGAQVIAQPQRGVAKWQVEVSTDEGKTWNPQGEFPAMGEARISGLVSGRKYLVRLVGVNGARRGDPSAAYPLYVSDQPPAAPAGLALELGRGEATASWGEVLGAARYRLLRRVAGSRTGWTKVYEGPERHFCDRSADAVTPPLPVPLEQPSASILYEYAVQAVNENGAGPLSAAVDTDPGAWRNWWPAQNHHVYQRRTGYLVPPFVSPAAVVPDQYESQ